MTTAFALTGANSYSFSVTFLDTGATETFSGNLLNSGGLDSVRLFAINTKPGIGGAPQPASDVYYNSMSIIPDFNNDNVVNAADIDLLCDAIDGGGLGRFDINADGTLDNDDVTFLVETLLNTRFGDSDIDGDVDLADLGNLASGFGVAGEKRWALGNFDCDDDVDLADLGTLATNFEAGRAAALAQFEALVPEPVTGIFIVGVLPGMVRRRRCAQVC